MERLPAPDGGLETGASLLGWPPFIVLTSSLRWDLRANQEHSFGRPIVFRSTSVSVSNTLPLTALSRRQATTSGIKDVEAAHAATSAGVQSDSLNGRRHSVTPGLASCVGGVEEVAGGAGESGGDRGMVAEERQTASTCFPLATGLSAKELLGEVFLEDFRGESPSPGEFQSLPYLSQRLERPRASVPAAAPVFDPVESL